MSSEVQFGSYTLVTGRKHDMDWFDWCVYVSADPAVVESIRQIEYRLHPTFPNPERTISTRRDRFALYSAGWGGFGLDIEVAFVDGGSSEQRYFLELEKDNWPRPALPAGIDAELAGLHEALKHRRYRWRKLPTVVRKLGLPEERVREMLGELEERNLVRRAWFTSIEGQELWGATEVVGVAPRL